MLLLTLSSTPNMMAEPPLVIGPLKRSSASMNSSDWLLCTMRAAPRGKAANWRSFSGLPERQPSTHPVQYNRYKHAIFCSVTFLLMSNQSIMILLLNCTYKEFCCLFMAFIILTFYTFRLSSSYWTDFWPIFKCKLMFYCVSRLLSCWFYRTV